MPGESPFSQRVTLTRTRHLVVKKQQPPRLFLWPRPTLSLTSLHSTSSRETGEWSRCSPPPKAPSVRSAGSLATSLTAVPANCPSVLSACSPIRKQSITALTLPALRVATSNRCSPAARPRWRAVLTARKSTLRAAGIAPPALKPPQTHQRCHLDRRSTAWISLKTRLALRRSFVQHQVPLLTSQVPLYCPEMLHHLGREPTAPSPISPQERVVMNPSTPTPLRALPNNGEFLYSIHGQQGCLPILSNHPTYLPWELGCFSFTLSQVYIVASPPHTCCYSRSPFQAIGSPVFSGIPVLHPASAWPPPGGYSCFLNFEPALVLLYCLSRFLRDAFGRGFFS